jgi:hypothetical protein
MKISNREKHYGSGFSAIKTDRRIPVKYDLQVLDLMATYVVSDNAYIKKSSLINLRNLINDPEKMKRINFIKRGLDGRLSGLHNPIAIIKHANGGILNDESFVPNEMLLSTDELNWLDENVSESLKYLYIYDYADELYLLLDKFKNGDFHDRGSIVSQIEGKVQDMQTAFRRAKTESSQAQMFSLRDDRYDVSISDIHRRATDPNRRLLSGMQGMNILVNGGFESGRVYGFFGITGIGKSLTLLNLAYQLKKYNKFYKAKDPTKTPVIVILTMENDVDETVKRLYSIATGASHDEFKSVPLDEVKRRMKEDGELYLSDDNPIDIIIKYMPSGGVDTSYMYSLVEELEDEGYETIAFIQDHLKKIRSANYRNADLRIELGEVINEFKSFAIAKDIPVFTCSHLNRDACSKMEMATQSSKADVTRMLGKSNMGESLLILDNIDFGFMINVEYDVNGNKYLCVWTQKKRDYTPIDYVVLPFGKNGIKLEEDFYLDKPLFKDSIGDTNEMKRAKINTSQYSNIRMLYDDDEEEEDSFTGVTKYSVYMDEPDEEENKDTDDKSEQPNPIPEPMPVFSSAEPVQCVTFAVEPKREMIECVTFKTPPEPKLKECVRFISNPPSVQKYVA